MFCHNCGAKLKEGVRFCTSCGADQGATPPDADSGQNQASSQHPGSPYTYERAGSVPPPKPGKGKKLLIPVIAAVLVVALIITGFATSGFGLIGSKAKNPVAVTYDAVKSVFDMESFEFEARIRTPDDDLRMDGYFIAGNSTETLTAFVNADDGYSSFEFGAYNGDFFARNKDYDEAYVFSTEHFKEELLYNLDIDSEIDESSLFDANRLSYNAIVVQSGKLLIDAFLDNSYYYYSYDGDDTFPEDLKLTEEEINEAYTAMEGFIYKALENEEIFESVIELENMSKSNGNKKDSLTTYEYSIKPQRLVREFYDYLIEEGEKHPELTKKIEEIIDEFDGDYSFNSGLKLIRDNILSELAYYDDVEFSIEITVDKPGNLRELSISFVSYGDRESFTLEINNINSVTPDIDELEKIIRDAEVVDYYY